MSRFTVPRMLATGSILGATTSLRAGAAFASLLAERAPRLIRLAMHATAGGASGVSQAAFRDELLGLARDSAELSWREMRHGVDVLDSSTRGEQRRGTGRPYRVKA